MNDKSQTVVKLFQPKQLKVNAVGIVTIDNIQIDIDPTIALFVAACVSNGSLHIEPYLDEMLRLQRTKDAIKS